jgi:hypothetical protein
MFWIAIPINALWGIVSSAEQVFMTGRVRPDEQASCMARSDLPSLAMIGAPMVFAGILP